MDHSTSLIATLAVGFALALIFGFIAERIGAPALIGYLIAGIVIGPATPGIVADVEVASQLSEIGIMLLMFGVGLHFSLDDLLAVKRIALPGAIVQMLVATVLGTWLAISWGWEPLSAVVFGLTLSVASTVVLLKALEVRGALQSMNGRIAVGWLIVEDLATVLVLVLLPPIAGSTGVLEAPIQDETSVGVLVLVTILQVGGFVALMLVIGRKALPWFLAQVVRTGSRELFTLTIVVFAIGVAFAAAELFNVSFALGAFFAGMVIRESPFGYRAAADSLPLRDTFAALFFVAVGMLFAPDVLLENPLRVILVVAIVMVGKSLAALGIVLLLRYPLSSAFVMGASLAQVGEFSLILAGLGVMLGVLEPDAVSLVVAAAVISIALNPLMFTGADIATSLIRRFPRLARLLEFEADPMAELPEASRSISGHVLLVGYGRVGRRIASGLRVEGIDFVVVELNREQMEGLRKTFPNAIAGNATDPRVLEQAGAGRAALVVIALPDPGVVRQVARTMMDNYPTVDVVLRTHSDEQAASLRSDGFGSVVFGEEKLADAMMESVMRRVGDAGPTQPTA